MRWSILFSDKQLFRVKCEEAVIQKIKNMHMKRNLKGHALTAYKGTLKLDDRQRSILVGTLLGDASMQAMTGNQLSNVKFEQKVSQADYINHLYQEFQAFVGTPPRIRKITGGGAADRESI